MRIAGKELKKLLCSPFLWFIFIVFLGMNWLQIYASVGGEFTNQQYRVIHDIIIEHGIDQRTQSNSWMRARIRTGIPSSLEMPI